MLLMLLLLLLTQKSRQKYFLFRASFSGGATPPGYPASPRSNNNNSNSNNNNNHNNNPADEINTKEILSMKMNHLHRRLNSLASRLLFQSVLGTAFDSWNRLQSGFISGNARGHRGAIYPRPETLQDRFRTSSLIGAERRHGCLLAPSPTTQPPFPPPAPPTRPPTPPPDVGILHQANSNSFQWIRNEI